MKSVDIILEHIRNQLTDFLEALSLKKIFEIVQENILKYSKQISFLDNTKLSLNHGVRLDHAILCNRMICCIFSVIFLHWNEAKIWKNYSVVQL